jgi:GNAT superfamily N-acetyltransferase
MGGLDHRKLLAIAIKHGVENGEAIFVADVDGELVGFVAWTGLPNAADGEAVGFGTYVVPEYRRRGISNALRWAAREHCQKLGYKFVTGTAMTGNTAGLQSVEALGFEIIGYEVRLKL